VKEVRDEQKISNALMLGEIIKKKGMHGKRRGYVK
jgi:hypothetical protein